MDAFISLIGTLGFPRAMCLWFMFRMEKLIKNNTEVMNKVLSAITKK